MEEGKGPLSRIQRVIGGFQNVSVGRRWVLAVSGMWLGGTKQKLKSDLGEKPAGVCGSLIIVIELSVRPWFKRDLVSSSEASQMINSSITESPSNVSTSFETPIDLLVDLLESGSLHQLVDADELCSTPRRPQMPYH